MASHAGLVFLTSSSSPYVAVVDCEPASTRFNSIIGRILIGEPTSSAEVTPDAASLLVLNLDGTALYTVRMADLRALPYLQALSSLDVLPGDRVSGKAVGICEKTRVAFPGDAGVRVQSPLSVSPPEFVFEMPFITGGEVALALSNSANGEVLGNLATLRILSGSAALQQIEAEIQVLLADSAFPARAHLQDALRQIEEARSLTTGGELKPAVQRLRVATQSLEGAARHGVARAALLARRLPLATAKLVADLVEQIALELGEGPETTAARLLLQTVYGLLALGDVGGAFQILVRAAGFLEPLLPLLRIACEAQCKVTLAAFDAICLFDTGEITSTGTPGGGRYCWGFLEARTPAEAERLKKELQEISDLEARKSALLDKLKAETDPAHRRALAAQIEELDKQIKSKEAAQVAGQVRVAIEQARLALRALEEELAQAEESLVALEAEFATSRDPQVGAEIARTRERIARLKEKIADLKGKIASWERTLTEALAQKDPATRLRLLHELLLEIQRQDGTSPLGVLVPQCAEEGRTTFHSRRSGVAFFFVTYTVFIPECGLFVTCKARRLAPSAVVEPVEVACKTASPVDCVYCLEGHPEFRGGARLLDFEVTTNPPGYEHLVQWVGGDFPPSGTGKRFTSLFVIAGAREILAKCHGVAVRKEVLLLRDKLEISPSRALLCWDPSGTGKNQVQFRAYKCVEGKVSDVTARCVWSVVPVALGTFPSPGLFRAGRASGDGIVKARLGGEEATAQVHVLKFGLTVRPEEAITCLREEVDFDAYDCVDGKVKKVDRQATWTETTGKGEVSRDGVFLPRFSSQDAGDKALIEVEHDLEQAQAKALILQLASPEATRQRVCVGEPVAVATRTLPVHLPGKILWEVEPPDGAVPARAAGERFTLSFSKPGVYRVFARCGGEHKSQPVQITAYAISKVSAFLVRMPGHHAEATPEREGSLKVCDGDLVRFSVETVPGGGEDLVSWDAAADPTLSVKPALDTSASRTGKHFDVTPKGPGRFVVTAVCGSSRAVMKVVAFKLRHQFPAVLCVGTTREHLFTVQPAELSPGLVVRASLADSGQGFFLPNNVKVRVAFVDSRGRFTLAASARAPSPAANAEVLSVALLDPPTCEETLRFTFAGVRLGQVATHCLVHTHILGATAEAEPADLKAEYRLRIEPDSATGGDAEFVSGSSGARYIGPHEVAIAEGTSTVFTRGVRRSAAGGDLALRPYLQGEPCGEARKFAVVDLVFEIKGSFNSRDHVVSLTRYVDNKPQHAERKGAPLVMHTLPRVAGAPMALRIHRVAPEKGEATFEDGSPTRSVLAGQTSLLLGRRASALPGDVELRAQLDRHTESPCASLPFRVMPLVVVIAYDGFGRTLAEKVFTDKGDGKAEVDSKGIKRIFGLFPKGSGTSLNPQGVWLKDTLSTYPSISMTAWASILTGQPPKVTGIAGNEFIDRTRQDLRNGMALRVNFGDGVFGLPALVGDPVLHNLRELRTEVYNLPGAISSPQKFLDAAKVPTVFQSLQDKKFITASIFHFYTQGLDYNRIPSAGEFALSLLRETAYLDNLAWAHARDRLGAKTEPLPDFLLTYFVALDHAVHEGGTQTGVRLLDQYVANLMNVLQESVETEGLLDDTVFMFVSDHGGTDTLNDRWRTRLAVSSGQRVVTPRRFIGLANVFDRAGRQLQMDRDHRGDAMLAFNGPSAHVYLKSRTSARSSNPWEDPPSDEEILRLAREFEVARLEGVADEGLNRGMDSGAIGAVFVRLKSRSGEYALFRLGAPGGPVLPLASLPEGVPGPSNEYVRLAERLADLNGRYSGDLVIQARFRPDEPPERRYYFDTRFKAWHGSMNTLDSYATLVLAYPGAVRGGSGPVWLGGRIAAATPQGKVQDFARIVRALFGAD